MDFEYSPRTTDLQARLRTFMDEHVYPAEAAVHEELAANTAAGKRWTPLRVIEDLKPKARAAGLWNLFLPESEYGAGLTNLEYAPLAEVMGRGKFTRRIQSARLSAAGLVDDYRHLAVLIDPQPLPAPVSRDADDDHVRACALTAGAAPIVSGDQDLLDLGTFRNIAILNAVAALEAIVPASG